MKNLQRGPSRPLGTILRDRSDARRALLRPQVEAALREMRRLGAVCEAIGSYARASAHFDDHSDVDILIEDHPNRSEAELWDIAWSNLQDAEVDLVFAHGLQPRTVALMKEYAHG